MLASLVTPDTIPIVGGVAVGVIGVGWTIASALRDRRYEHMGSQVNYFQKLLEQCQQERLEEQEKNAILKVRITHLEKEMEEVMGTKLDTIQDTVTDIHKKVDRRDKPSE